MPPKKTPQQNKMAKAWHSTVGRAMKSAMKKVGAVAAWKSAAGKAFKHALKK